MVRARSDHPHRLTPVAELPNLGPTTAAWLADIGVHTHQDLQVLGVMAACRAIRLNGHRITVVGAYALHGAVIGRSWRALPPATVAQLRERFVREVLADQPSGTVAARRRSPAR